MSFVIMESGGRYEDAWSNPIGVASTMGAAEDFIKKIKDEKINIAKIYERLTNASLDYRPIILERIGKCSAGDDEQIPKWPSGLAIKDITPEMRAERQAIIDRNDDRQSIRIEHSNLFYEHLNAFHTGYLTGLGIPEEKHHLYLRNSNNEDVHYSIEEVPEV